MKIARRSLFALLAAPLLLKPVAIDVEPINEDLIDYDSPQSCEDHYRHAWTFCRALKGMELRAIRRKYPRTWKKLQFTGVCLFQCKAAIVYGTGTPSHSKAEVQRMEDLFGPRVVTAYRTPKGRVWVMMVKGESVAAIRTEIEGRRKTEFAGGGA